MDQPGQPQDPMQPPPQEATQVAPPPQAGQPPPTAGPAPATAPAWPPPPVAPPTPPPPYAAPPPGYPPQWAVPAEPAGPAPGVAFAAHGGRLIAYVVDAILVGVIVTAVAIALAVLTGVFAATGAAPLAVLSAVALLLAVFVVSLGYFPYFWVNGGATPGMRIFNLRLVRDRDGGPLGWGEAILRLIGFWVSGAVFYLGFVWILVDSRRRGWHDLIAGTVMVQPA